MSFFGNGAVNRVNLHSGVRALAEGAGGIFVLVFLLTAGVPIALVLLAQAAIIAGRFLLRPAVVPLAKRWGLKPLLIGGTLGVALQYPLLAQVHGVGGPLLILVIVAAVGEVLYSITYNAYYAALGDAEHRGHQLGAREALVATAGIVAPLLGALALVELGPGIAFACVGLVQAAAALPLLGLPNVRVREAAPGAFKSAWPAVALWAVDGWFDAFFFYAWHIALFVSLSQSLPAYGGAMALAGLAGAAGTLALGRHIDAGHGRRAVWIAFGLAVPIVLLRAVAVGSPGLAVTANALGAFLMPMLGPVMAGAVYNLAKVSPCPVRFLVAAEAGWDVGCFAACLLAAALAFAGAPMSVALLLGLPAVALGIALLRRQYPAAAAAELRP